MCDFDLTKIDDLLNRLRSRGLSSSIVYRANGEETEKIENQSDYVVMIEADQDCVDAVAAIETLLRKKRKRRKNAGNS